MKKWWVANITWLVIFGGTAIFLMVREVDGHGAIQTTEARLISLAVVGIVFVPIVIVQAVWGYFAYKKTKRNHP